MTNRTSTVVAVACCAAGALLAATAGAQQSMSTTRPHPDAVAVAGASSGPDTVTTGAAPEPARCAAPEYRQLDFWLGEWDVLTPAGERAGSDRVTSVLGGCVIQEEWTDADGRRGMSMTSYAGAAGLWHQTYVDDQGTLLRIAGRATDGKVVLLGVTPLPRGGNLTHRISYQPAGDASGGVRQLWQTSRDDGRTWSTLFEGIYRKRR
jgi:hypothetical protein